MSASFRHREHRVSSGGVPRLCVQRRLCAEPGLSVEIAAALSLVLRAARRGFSSSNQLDKPAVGTDSGHQALELGRKTVWNVLGGLPVVANRVDGLHQPAAWRASTLPRRP